MARHSTQIVYEQIYLIKAGILWLCSVEHHLGRNITESGGHMWCALRIPVP
jgi:hypothetical protein